MDYQAYYRKVEDGNYQAYYDAIAAAEPRDPQATARTRDADGTIPGQARERMFNIAGEIQNTSREFGVPLPPLLEGCTVVDLCCGSGRDTYLAAQLVGPAGKVIGVEPNAVRMRIGEKYLEKEMKQFGYDAPNVEFHKGCPEDLSFIPDGSVDVVISNCTFNERRAPLGRRHVHQRFPSHRAAAWLQRPALPDYQQDAGDREGVRAV